MDAAKLRECARHQEGLLLLAYTILLFYPFDPNLPLLVELRDQWEAAGRSKSRELLADVFLMLRGEPLDVRLVPFVVALSAIDTHNGPHSAIPPIMRMPPSTRTIAESLISARIRNLMSHGLCVREVFKEIIKFMQFKGLPDDRVMCLIHMMEKFIGEGAMLEEDQHKEAMDCVKHLLYLQVPGSTMANNLLWTLDREWRSPGATLRRRLFAEHPELDIAKLLGEPKGNPVEKSFAHIIINQDSWGARVFHEMLRVSTSAQPSDEELRWELLSNALISTLGLDAVNGLVMPVPKVLDEQFKEAMHALADAERDRSDPRAALKERLAKVKDVLSKADKAEEALLASDYRSLRLPPLRFHIMRYPRFLSYKLDERIGRWHFPTTTTLNMLTRVLYATVKRIAGAEACEGGESSDDIEFGSIDLVDEPFGPTWGREQDTPTIVRIGIAGGDGTLHNVVNAYCTLRHTSPHLFCYVDLRFYVIPLGQINNFSNFLGVYDGWYHRHVLTSIGMSLIKQWPRVTRASDEDGRGAWIGDSLEAAAMGEFAVDLAPLDSSLKSEEPQPEPPKPEEPPQPTGLSLDDISETETEVKEVQKEVEPEVVPEEAEQTDVTSAEAAAFDTPSPAFLVRHELENFFREADQPLQVVLYKAECWSSLEGSESGFMTVPFIQSADIGLVSSVAQYCDSRGIVPRLTIEQAMEKGQFKFKPLELNVKVMGMDLQGTSRPPVSTRTSIWNLSVESTPDVRVGEKRPGMCPDPHTKSLDMHMIEVDSKRKKVYDVPGSTQHVGMVELELIDKKAATTTTGLGAMWLLADGRYFGPFHRIRLSACRVSSKSGTEYVMTMPFMTFFPVDF